MEVQHIGNLPLDGSVHGGLGLGAGAGDVETIRWCVPAVLSPVDPSLGMLPQRLGQGIGQASFALDRVGAVGIDDQGHPLLRARVIPLQQRLPACRRLIGAEMFQGMVLGPPRQIQTLLGLPDQLINLIHPGLLVVCEQGVLSFSKQISAAADGAEHRGQAHQAAFHPAVGAFGIGEGAGLQHHQADVALPQSPQVVREGAVAAAADPALKRLQRQRQLQAAQQIQTKLGVLPHQLGQGWCQLLMPDQGVGCAGTGHHQAQSTAALA